MNENENTHAEKQEGVIDLGAVSVETKGDPGPVNEGALHTIMPGISEE